MEDLLKLLKPRESAIINFSLLIVAPLVTSFILGLVSNPQGILPLLGNIWVWTALVIAYAYVLQNIACSFRLKRLVFWLPRESRNFGLPAELSTVESGIYRLEAKVFASLGLTAPTEIPIDIIMDVGSFWFFGQNWILALIVND